MKKHALRRQDGFTIIEVVLVLAIAGLIFLVVFLALPQLQRSQRDSARRSDVGRLVAGINSYMTNNNGQVPTFDTVAGDPNATPPEPSKVIGNYVEDWDYTLETAGNEDFDSMAYVAGGECDADSRAVAGTNSRQFAVSVQLESGTGVYYCAEG